MNRASVQIAPKTSFLASVLGVFLLAGGGNSQPLPEAGPRVQVRFAGPVGMRVWFQAATGRFEKDPRVEVPGRINLRPGCVYRLKLADIPNRPGLVLYPTLEIGRLRNESAGFLAHQAVPLEFTDEEFDRVVNGQVVTKVVTLAGEGRGVTSFSGQGAPLQEAMPRGAVLIVVRVGNIDLEATSPK